MSYLPASMDCDISKMGNCLISLLKRFVNQYDFIKDITKVQCTKTLSVPLVVDEMTFHNIFSIIATENVTWAINWGHYTALIKQSNSSPWNFCNDAANNTSSYTYIYEAI